jgi:hypothetical protein
MCLPVPNATDFQWNLHGGKFLFEVSNFFFLKFRRNTDVPSGSECQRFSVEFSMKLIFLVRPSFNFFSASLIF